MNKKHVLIVDDEAGIREILAEGLSSPGCRVTVAESVAMAMEVVSKDRPDLIITDLQMEEADGFDLIDELKTAGPDIPVILLTGVLLDQSAVRTATGGKDVSYLPKSSSLAEIIATARRYLAK